MCVVGRWYYIMGSSITAPYLVARQPNNRLVINSSLQHWLSQPSGARGWLETTHPCSRLHHNYFPKMAVKEHRPLPSHFQNNFKKKKRARAALQVWLACTVMLSGNREENGGIVREAWNERIMGNAGVSSRRVCRFGRYHIWGVGKDQCHLPVLSMPHNMDLSQAVFFFLGLVKTKTIVSNIDELSMSFVVFIVM